MKTLYLILFAFLVSQISSRKCVEATLPTKASDCHDSTDKDAYYRCCYIYVKDKSGQEVKTCFPIDEATYKDIGKAIDEQKKNYPDLDKIKFDCNSKYVALSVLSLILLLL
jgi:hypothetical protein